MTVRPVTAGPSSQLSSVAQQETTEADRIMRKADLRPRAMAISSHRCVSGIGRDTSMQTHRQANLDIFS